MDFKLYGLVSVEGDLFVPATNPILLAEQVFGSEVAVKQGCFISVNVSCSGVKCMLN